MTKTKAKKVQHSRRGRFQKIFIRSMVPASLPGAVYVPFIGDGDLALRCWLPQKRRIYGVDLNPARVATARERLPGAVINCADASLWSFAADVSEPFAIADIDAYSNPYPALRAFWANAPKAPRVFLFLTDSLRTVNSGQPKLGPEGPLESALTTSARVRVMRRFIPDVLLPWIERFMAPYQVCDRRIHYGGHSKQMVYIGLELRDKSAISAIRNPQSAIPSEFGFMMAIMSPQEIREARLALQMSQSQFGAFLGVGSITVSRWERGKYEPQPYLRLAIYWIEARQKGKVK